MAEGPITREELRDIIRETMSETLTNTLTTLGIDLKEPIEVQQDFAFVRAQRKGYQAVKRHATITAVGIFILGGLALIWSAITGKGLPGQ